VIAIAATAAGTARVALAVGFGVALRRAGARVAVIETDLEHGALATVVGLDAVPSLSRVLAGELPLTDALVDGPQDVRIAAGARGGSNRLGTGAQRTLLAQIDALGDRYDAIVLSPAADRSAGTIFAVGAAHAAVVIVTPEQAAGGETLETLRLLSSRVDDALGVVVHGAPDAARARADYAALVGRVRFGALARLAYLGWIPCDPEATAYWDPASPAGRAVAALVDPWRLAPPARPHGGLQFFFEPLLAAREAA
jgi:MinD-like ATPase involved in chromosome partitioning or flagellar assembly